MTLPETDKPSLRHAIGIALTVIAFTNCDLTRGNEVRLQHARHVYGKLKMEKAVREEIPFLLIFRLFGLFMVPQNEANDQESMIQSTCEALVGLSFPRGPGSGYTISSFSRDFDWRQHSRQVALHWLRICRQEPGTLGHCSLSALCLDAILRPELCAELGGPKLMTHLMDVFTDTTSPPDELTRICLLGFINCNLIKGSIPTEIIEKLLRDGVIERLVGLAGSSRAETAPYYMRLIWTMCIGLRANWWYRDRRSPLKTFYDCYNGGLHDQELTRDLDVGGMGLAERWVHDLIDMCGEDPQDGLRSGILSQMIESYRKDGGERVIPQAVELPSRFSDVSTWLTVLQKLEDDCKAAVEDQTNKQEQEGANRVEEVGTAPDREGIGESINQSV